MRKLYRAFVSLFAGVFLLVVGCSTPYPLPPRLVWQGHPIINVHVYIDNQFTERERDNIINGVMMWEHATNGLVTWSLKPFDPYNPPAPPRGLYEGVEERTVLFRRAISTDEWVKAWDAEHQPKKTLLGLCQGNSMKELAWLWLVEDRMKVGDAETMIASHEFGHAIGLDHISDTSSVMSEFYNQIVKCLTIADLEEFCDKHNCSTALVTTACKPD